jgi:TonB family protein
MLRTIGRFGITLLVVSTLEITISSRNPLLARARGITSYSSNLSTDLSAETAEVPEELAPNRSTSPSSRPSELREGTEGSPTSSGAARVVCISGCLTEYPSVLNGEEGTAVVRVVLDNNGNVVDSQILESGGSSQLNQEALEAARKMKFRVPGGGSRFAVRLPINFTIRGSDFARQARERQAQLERERQQREQERQAQLERERQERERQAQLEREHQTQQQQERQDRERVRQIPPSSRPTVGLICVSGCSPKYPAVLAGEEGSARVRLMVDRNGNVVDAQVLGGTAVIKFGVEQNGNVVPKAEETSIYSKLAEAALGAAIQMKFTPTESGDRVAVIVNINFTIAGSEFGRQVRERRTQNGREGQTREREVQLEELNLVPSE